LKDAKKVLSDYKKATGNKIAIIDLMVHYVECGNDFTLQFGDLDEPYYASIESVFESALKLMKTFDDHEVDDFIARLKEVVRKADGIGWGYHDAIEEMMSKAYP
jgi:ATP-dependent DNA ligase